MTWMTTRCEMGWPDGYGYVLEKRRYEGTKGYGDWHKQAARYVVRYDLLHIACQDKLTADEFWH